jgi:hypothetical protein
MSFYKLPLGIRVPNNDEYPSTYDVKEINDNRKNANIIEGYTIKEASGEKFTHYVEVNVDSDKVWDLFCAISNKIIDKVSYGIIGFKDEEPILSNFNTTENLIHIYEEYSFELANDGFLQFGIANYNNESLNEIFVTNFKYMKIWTDKKDILIKTLNSFGIYFVENLQFIDGFPVVSEALSCEKVNGIRHYSDVLKTIEQKFKRL